MATPNRINDQGDEELLCATCQEWFVPKDGQVDVLRISAEDPGDVVCKECINNALSRGLLERDEENAIVCRCNSTEHAHCPIHLTLNM